MHKIMEPSQGSSGQGFLLCETGEVRCLGRLHREDTQKQRCMFKKPQGTSRSICDDPSSAMRPLC